MYKQVLLHLSTILASTTAYTYPGGVWGFGLPNGTAFSEANQNPNATKSVPFQLGDRNFTLRVNVADFALTDADTNVENPRMAASFYELEWSGGSSLNDTVSAAESVVDGGSLRLSVTVPLGLYSATVTNNYKDNDDGDCSGALGKDCVNDLKAMSYDLSAPYGTSLPASCQSKMPTGGTGSTSMLGINGTGNSTDSEIQSSPFGFAYYTSPVYSAGNESRYQREAERLHVVVLSGKQTYPVCLRVKTDHVSKGDPSTSGAARSCTGSIGLSVVIVLVASLYLL